MTKIHYSMLLYGLSGSGKTSLLGQLIRQLLPLDCKARLVTCENYSALMPLIEEGLLECWRVNTRPFPFETSRAAIRGFWPTDTTDPESPLVAPTPETWKTFPIRLFEGIGTFAQYISSNHIEGGLLHRAGLGEVMGPVQEHIKFMDGSEGVAGLCWTHYRIGQSEMLGLVQSAQKHPGYVIFTSHEDDGKERGLPFVGPEVIGSKMTGVIGKEFDDLLRIATVPIDFADGNGGIRHFVERRLYLKEHAMNGLVYKAKNSAGLAAQAELPEFLTLTEPAEPWKPREGVAALIAEKLRLA